MTPSAKNAKAAVEDIPAAAFLHKKIKEDRITGKFFKRKTDIGGKEAETKSEEKIDWSLYRYDHIEIQELERIEYNRLYGETDFYDSYGKYTIAKRLGMLKHNPPIIPNPLKRQKAEETQQITTAEELKNNYNISVADYFGGNLII